MAEISVVLDKTTTAAELYDLHDKCQAIFVAQLGKEAGTASREHLRKERGLSDATVVEAGIGYIPDGKAAFVDLAVAHGLSLEACVDAALVKRSDYKVKEAFRKKYNREPGDSSELSSFFFAFCRNQKQYYRDYHSVVVGEDAARQFLYGDWLTLPVYVQTPEGKRIGGFQLRSMRPKAQIGKQGRYRNPVNTVAMIWNETLLGLAEETDRIVRTGEVILVEGRFDQLAVIEALRNETDRPGVVGLGGISLRGVRLKGDATAQERAGILAQLPSKRVRLFLDSDQPGTDAILQVGPRLSAMDMLVAVCRIQDVWEDAWGPLPKDVGEVLSTRGTGVVRAILEAGRKTGLVSYATSALELRMRQGRTGGQSWEVLEALDVLHPLLVAAPSVVRERAVASAARVVGLSVAALERIVKLENVPNSPHRKQTV